MKYLLILFAIAVAFFAAFPDFDLTVSGWFFDAEAGIFAWRDHPVTRGIHLAVRILTAGIFCGLCAGIAAALLKPYLPFLRNRVRWSARALIYLLLTLALGPGLLVHQVIKDNWGRARPMEIRQFGGEKLYTPPLAVSDQGGKSFVSGHAATGFFAAAFALLIGNRRKRIAAYALGLAFGVVISAARIVQGGHFLSDTVFAGLLTLLLAHTLHRVIVGRKSD